MSAEIAWLIFGVGVAATVINLLTSWIDERGLLATLLLATLLVGTAVACLFAPDRVGAFTEVFTAAGVVFAAVKYVRDRHDDEQARLSEARSARNDRLIAEWQAFVANEKYVRAIYILEVNDPCLERLRTTVEFDEYKAWKNQLDQVFDFLQRLAYSVECRNLEPTAVREAVGWYFRRISELEPVREYCSKNGYATILEFVDNHRQAPRIGSAS
jgi:hypothetical protein